MKIAISGKGGVGKTLLTTLLSQTFAKAGYRVLAVDADPDANLAANLGFPHPETIVPVSQMKDLIEKRTGSPSGKPEIFFKLNPKVDDLPEKYWMEHKGIRLMVMGRIKKGGSGCYCTENTLLRALISHLLIVRNEIIIIDTEAGIEHLGRATASAVDKLIIVVEPGRRSIETAHTIKQLASDVGLQSIAVVGNKIHNQSEKEFIKSNLPDFEFLGFMSYDSAIIAADLANLSLLSASPQIASEVEEISKRLSFITGGKAQKSVELNN